MADASMLIVTTVVVAVGTTEMAAVVAKKSPPFPPIVAGFALGTFLFLVNLAAPDIAQAFCVLIIVTALLINGKPLFNLAAKIGG